MTEQPFRYGAGLPGPSPEALLTVTTSSFTEFLARNAPHLLPGNRIRSASGSAPDAVHGTTVLGLLFPGGVVVAGDRRGTMGNLIAQRELKKIAKVDAHTCLGFAGSVGTGVEFVRLFQLELEHYEKIEGATLSFPGKCNRMASMVRQSLGAAMQGLAYVPLLAGYDLVEQRGRVVSCDIAGSVTEQREFEAIGSGSFFAKSALKKLYRPDLSEANAVRAAIEALVDAADEDSATAGLDAVRRVYPTVSVVTAEGVREWDDDEVGGIAAEVVAGRRGRPDGPTRL